MFDPPAPNQVAGQPAANNAPPATAEDLVAELARVKERLSFYESFDTLIRDNVLRSGELLREVAAERERTDQKLLDMRAEVDRRLAEQRSALEEIAAGLSGLQSNLSALAERVSGSLSALADSGSTSLLDKSSDDVSLADRVPSMAGTSARADEAGVAALASPLTPVEEAAERMAGDNDLGVPELRIDARDVPALAAIAQAPEPTVATNSADVPAQVADTVHSSAVPEDAGPVRRKIDLIVHGVPRAATALSLQRHLQELAGVEAVEVREYVSGVLRFQVVAVALAPDDFRSWQSGDGLEVITARDDVLELKLPTADGL